MAQYFSWFPKSALFDLIPVVYDREYFAELKCFPLDLAVILLMLLHIQRFPLELPALCSNSVAWPFCAHRF